MPYCGAACEQPVAGRSIAPISTAITAFHRICIASSLKRARIERACVSWFQFTWVTGGRGRLHFLLRRAAVAGCTYNRQRPDTLMPRSVANEVDTIHYCPARRQVRCGPIRQPLPMAAIGIANPDILLSLR